jgi:ribosomal protein S18 acetylase RimI-like enzyme
VTIRPFCEGDRAALHQLTLECFGNSMYVAAEELFGPFRGLTWQERKLGDIDGDVSDPEGVLVATDGDEVLGFVTTQLHPPTGIGHIANLAVAPAHQGKGVGAALLRAALARLAARGMTHARIETLEHNVVGRHLYPKLGFREIARQIHYLMEIPPQAADAPSGPAAERHGDH